MEHVTCRYDAMACYMPNTWQLERGIAQEARPVSNWSPPTLRPQRHRTCTLECKWGTGTWGRMSANTRTHHRAVAKTMIEFLKSSIKTESDCWFELCFWAIWGKHMLCYYSPLAHTAMAQTNHTLPTQSTKRSWNWQHLAKLFIDYHRPHAQNSFTNWKGDTFEFLKIVSNDRPHILTTLFGLFGIAVY